MNVDSVIVFINKMKQATKERIKIFKEAMKLKINTEHHETMIAMLNEQLDFYEEIEKIVNTKSNSPALNAFLKTAIKDEWIRVEIQVIVQDMLKEKDEAYKKKLNRWYELLKTDGINSKLMVANDIQNIIKEIENGN